MKRKLRVGTLKHPLIVLTLLCAALLVQQSCSTDKVEAPSLTGPSGHRLFITMTATPDHLVIKNAGKKRATSLITAQLKDQTGKGIGGENIKFRITNTQGAEVNIGTLDRLAVATDSGGFARVTYTAPNTSEQPIPVRIYIIAIMTNPAFTFEVTGRHSLDLEAAQPPLDCVFGGIGAPVAAFTVTPSPGTINEPVCFDNSPTTDDGLIINTTWVFGDGGVGAGDNVCHTYTSEGLFFVNMTVQDEDRNCSIATQLVSIGTGTAAGCSILVSPQNPPLGTSVELIAVVSDDGRVRRFNWTFGDGTSTTTNTNTVSHLYTTEGSFTVLLTITDDQGNVSTCQVVVTIGSLAPICTFTISPTPASVGQTVIFNSSGSSDPDGSIVTREWTFGDGFQGSGVSATHVYTSPGTYIVGLTLTDDQGNQTTCTQTIVVTSDAPDCDFTFSPTNPNVGANVSFNASTSSDPDGTIVNYAWDFGDGGTSPTNASATVNHTYNTAGTFTVTLTLTDNDGNTSSCSKNITVGSGAPVCQFTRNPSGNIVAGTTVTLQSTSFDPDGGAVTHAWSTPGGSPPSGTTNPLNVTYNTPGTFNISLTVTDDEGQSTACPNQQVVVTNGNPPTCSASGSPNPANIGQTVNFTGTASDPDGGTLTFLWQFGDGFTSTSQNPSHVYNTAGNFQVTFTVTDPQGNQCIDTVPMVINPPTMTITDVTQAEGSSGGTTAFIFSVNLSGASQSDITVQFATADGTSPNPATAPSDYSATAGTLTILAGSTSGSITVNVVADLIGEPNEEFFVDLSNSTNATLGDPRGVGTIVNDD